MLKKIIVTGGDGRFAQELKKNKSKYNFVFRNKNQLNILSIKSIEKNIKEFKPKYVLHLAGLSRPMSIHDHKISRSIDLNIVGTCNLVKICILKKIKLIFFSTSYVYPGTKGNYKETDPVLPWNNYGWSKLGAEAAVQMYKNSLIIRACMTEKPFIHDYAYSNVKSNFIFHDDIAKKILKVIDKKGVINIGGKAQSIYKFAIKNKKNVKKKISKGEFPKKMDMNLKKLKKIINK
ncbi:sugar nucleotide-binding protein [Pelagibacteraceae bacterium]|jgi:dTDP-4-dehydrorhamnose reductase|nr:sugar nucleotide-binding protein [Pelagibacteraceae bacterium]MDC0365827.1 sugar nucleotide-binding protein [Pelagibacteraceae bacterium]|tara:strand:- start:782 stop:1483 length:702 start_codon:yes stop_codon:yes gene_type:complete